MKIHELATPALLLDAAAMERNAALLDRIRSGTSMALYPHYKSHKCPAIALWQLRRGAAGITCAKLSEAQDLAAAGVKNIVIANQIVQAEKLPLLAELANRVRLTVCVDSEENILALEKAMAETEGTLHVLVEYEVGMRRCGAETHGEVLTLAQLISRQPHLHFEGIQAYAGHLAHEYDAQKRRRELLAIEQDVAALKAYLEENGLAVAEIGGGSTGTVADKPQDTVYTELQCGSYLFMDRSYQLMDLAFEQALSILVTVVSVKADRVVVDCGVKSMAMDQKAPVFPDFPEAALSFSEEHTTIFTENSSLRVGDRIRFIPGHCCTTINTFSEIHLTEGEDVATSFPIVSRGRAQ